MHNWCLFCSFTRSNLPMPACYVMFSKAQPHITIRSLLYLTFSCTVISYCNNCFGSQENCSYTGLSSLKHPTAVRTQWLMTSALSLHWECPCTKCPYKEKLLYSLLHLPLSCTQLYRLVPLHLLMKLELQSSSALHWLLLLSLDITIAVPLHFPGVGVHTFCPNSP